MNSIYLRFNKFERKSLLEKFSIPYSSFYNMKKRSLKFNKIDSSNTNKAAESDAIDSVILEIIKNWVDHPQY